MNKKYDVAFGMKCLWDGWTSFVEATGDKMDDTTHAEIQDEVYTFLYLFQKKLIRTGLIKEKQK